MQLGVSSQLIFNNRFVSAEELVEHVGSADIYITPYRQEAQVVSGTLAIALGAGKAIISTPYWHAKELLAEKRGVIVPFDDSDAIAHEVIELLENDAERHAMRNASGDGRRPMVPLNISYQDRNRWVTFLSWLMLSIPLPFPKELRWVCQKCGYEWEADEPAA